jgi:hypothetical protein
MSSKGKPVASFATIIQAERSAKADSTKVETFQDETTYVQYVGRIKPGEFPVPHGTVIPTRRWPSLKLGSGDVLLNKGQASAAIAQAQWEAAHLQEEPNGFCQDLGVVAEALKTPEAVLGFGIHDRAFEVALTDGVVEKMLQASLSGDEHVASFKERTRQSRIKNLLYRKSGAEVQAELDAIEASAR